MGTRPFQQATVWFECKSFVSETLLTGIPPEAWNYRLGNHSALKCILAQYKEKKLKAPTIREKFNTYRFANYKEKVIDLLGRVNGERSNNGNCQVHGQLSGP